MAGKESSVTYKPDMMIYHANCADGFGAAWAAWMKWGDTVDYVACAYGEEPPEVLGKHVLIGDFSFKKATLDRIAEGAASIVILDHHKTAEDDLTAFRVFREKPHRFTIPVIHSMIGDLQAGPYPAVLALFDMSRSGAVMMWQFCHPDVEIPTMLRLIEDRDLWRFAMPDAKPFALWLRSEPFDFQRWELIAQELNDGRDAHRIMAEAAAMQRFFDQKVGEIALFARFDNIAGYKVPVCNCPPMFASEVGHKLLEDFPHARFAACYSDQTTSRSYSLRSADDRLDVSEVARKFGGGGHRNAAGFGVPLP